MATPSAADTGIRLGILNLLFVALAIVWMEPRISSHEVVAAFITILTVGVVPCLFVGWCTGVIAGASCRWPVAIRLSLIAVLPLTLVVFLGSVVMLGHHVVPAFIPTAVAIVILEQRTREVAPAPLPIAAVQ